mgnify:CR=1 FL=1|tara:strand:+ start:50 stop:742 length:693 start_codon:yes stop_codon:yes gene_type:complete
MQFLKYYQKIDDAISYLLSSVSNEKKLLKDVLGKKEITFIDIGANVGNYLDFVKKNFKIKKIYCFEPIESLAKDLEKKILDIKKGEIYNCALSSKNSSKKFYLYDISSQSSFYKQNDTYSSVQKIKKKVNVNIKVFDKIFKKNLKIDFCKIDAQGEEYNILIGMKKNLKKGNIKLLKVELSFPLLHKNTNSTYLDILNYLNRFGYDLFSISKIKFKNNEIFFMDAFFKKR